MKNKKTSIKTVIIVILIGIIIALVMMNLNNKNNNIEQQLIQKEQLGEITEDDAYVLMKTHTSEVKEEEQKLISFKSVIANAITEMGVETETNADADTMVSNIKNILNSGELVHLGNISFTGSNNHNDTSNYTYNISKLRTDYNKLTANNFIVAIGSWHVTTGYQYGTTGSIGKTYNADTGILTVSVGKSCSTGSGNNSLGVTMSASVFMI